MNQLSTYSHEELCYLLSELNKLHQLTSTKSDREGVEFLAAKIRETKQEISRRN